jgi:hypothetical protein
MAKSLLPWQHFWDFKFKPLPVYHSAIPYTICEECRNSKNAGVTSKF